MGYRLLWEDRFDKDGAPDPTIWSFATGGSGFGNNESQFYTDRPENAFVRDGVLTLVARKETWENRFYTSAKLTTAGKKSIGYGRVEVEAQLPDGAGTWPAIWFLGDNIRQVGWPRCGEIDLMEHVGKRPDYVHFSLHCHTFNFHLDNHRTHVEYQPGVRDAFHTYAVERDENRIAFFLDDRQVAVFEKKPGDTADQWPFDQSFYLILNLAIGGHWGGAIDDTIFPVSIRFRSVRVFERG